MEERWLPSVVSISSVQNAAEPASDGFFRLSRDNTSGSLTVSYVLNTASTTATSGSDFAPLSGSISFGIGQATVDIPVTVYDDSDVEGNETVVIDLEPGGGCCGCGGSGGYSLGSPSSAMLTIADDDSQPPIGDIGTLKGTELNGGSPLPNSVTVAGAGGATLFISPGNTVRLEVFAPPGGNLPPWNNILYSIDGTSASPASGNFAGANWPEISFTGQAASYFVSAGKDLNASGTLEAAEVTHQFIVRVINFKAPRSPPSALQTVRSSQGLRRSRPANISR